MSISKMQKLAVIGLDTEKESLMSKLSELGAVELIDQKTKLEDELWQELVVQDDNLAYAQQLDQKANRGQAALELLERFDQSKAPLFSTRKRVKRADVKSMVETLPDVEVEIDTILNYGDEMHHINEAINKMDADLVYIAPWKAYDLPMELTHTKVCNIHKGTFPGDKNLDEIMQELEKQFEGFSFQTVSKTKEFTYAAWVSLKENDEELLEAMKENGFTEISFGELTGTPAECSDRLLAALEEKKRGLSELGEKVAGHVGSKAAIEAYFDIISLESEKEKNRSKLLKTEQSFFLEGWIPEKCVAVADAVLAETDCYYVFADPAEDEKPPVLLDNSAVVTPFESVTEMYALPAYGSFDPTKIFAGFYVIFFGMMLSDAAYGILMSIACFIILKKYDLEGMAYKLIKMFFYCGFSTLFWGALFGGWFGDIATVVADLFFGKDLVIKPLWFNPIEDPIKLLIFSLGLGVAHLFTGLGIKAYMDIKDGRWFDAICDEGFWIVTISGICAWLGGAMAIPAIAGVGQWMTIIGVLGLLLTGGRKRKGFGKVIGGLSNVYNITSYLSDILSYSRILALGLATGVIASVVNTMGSIFGGGIVGAILLLCIFIFGHILNIAINVLGAYVHTCRLQYVEFFGKFYEDGGEPFEPMGNKTKYIRIENDKI